MPSDDYYSPPPGYDADDGGEVVKPPPGYFSEDYEETEFPDYRVFEGEYRSYEQYPKGARDNILAGFCHLIPILGILMVLVKKNISPYLRFQALQGFTVGVILYLLACFAAILLTFVCLFWVPILIVAIITAFAAVMCWVGVDVRYPFIAQVIERKFI